MEICHLSFSSRSLKRLSGQLACQFLTEFVSNLELAACRNRLLKKRQNSRLVFKFNGENRR
jgi:hypothetical protein